MGNRASAADSSSSFVRRSVAPRDLHTIAADAALFFCILPKDVVHMLMQFLQWARAYRGVRHTTQLDFPVRGVSICFDHQGHLVVPLSRDNEVRVYDITGKLLRRVGRHHRCPSACAVDTRGRVFVAEYHQSGVCVFGADGRLEQTIGEGHIPAPVGLALSCDDSTLYVIQNFSGVVQSYSTVTGEFVRWFGMESSLGYSPRCVAALSDGTVAIAFGGDSFGAVLFSADGRRLRTVGVEEHFFPARIAADEDDNMYMLDDSDNVVLVYSRAGCHIDTITIHTPPGAPASHPRDIAVSPSGRFVVMDAYECRMDVFQPICNAPAESVRIK